jgi:hypothetical protein
MAQPSDLSVRLREALAILVATARAEPGAPEGDVVDIAGMGITSAEATALRKAGYIARVVGSHWRVRPAGFAADKARSGEKAGGTLPSLVMAAEATVSATATVTRTRWFDRVPSQAPEAVRNADSRARAITELEKIRGELSGETGNEWLQSEQFAVDAFALPGIDLALEALRMGEAITGAWHRARDLLMIGIEKLQSAKMLSGQRAGDVAIAVAAGLLTTRIDRAIALLLGLFT